MYYSIWTFCAGLCAPNHWQTSETYSAVLLMYVMWYSAMTVRAQPYAGSFLGTVSRPHKKTKQNKDLEQPTVVGHHHHYHNFSSPTANNKINANMMTASGTNMACRLCRFPGSDLRLAGCGCTIHAVSLRRKRYTRNEEDFYEV